MEHTESALGVYIDVANARPISVSVDCQQCMRIKAALEGNTRSDNGPPVSFGLRGAALNQLGGIVLFQSNYLSV